MSSSTPSVPGSSRGRWARASSPVSHATVPSSSGSISGTSWFGSGAGSVAPRSASVCQSSSKVFGGAGSAVRSHAPTRVS